MKSTPWGPSQGQKTIAEGITSYYTAGHGGYELSRERWEELEKEIPTFISWAGAGWLEEDCDWAVAAVLWPEHFSAQSVFNAIRTSRNREDIPASFWAGRGAKANAIAESYEKETAGKWEAGCSGSPPKGYPVGSWWMRLRRGNESREVVFPSVYSDTKQFYTDEELDELCIVKEG